MFFREGLKRLYNMLTAEDKVLLAGKGITEEQIEEIGRASCRERV